MTASKSGWYGRLFDTSATARLLNLPADEKIDRRERERLKQLVREA